MKKILSILALFLVLLSCEDFDDLNNNTKDPAVVSGESLFTNAQKNLLDQMVDSDVNLNIFRLIVQHWTETTYTDESNYDLFTRTIPDNIWDVFYRDVISDLTEAKKVIEETEYSVVEDPAVKTNKLAINEIMTVYAYSILVETFGDVPYSEAMDVENPTPVYDDALTIYTDLISRLSAAIASLNPDQGSFDLADNIYQGDVSNWIKFGNSLKLRMGLLLSDVAPTTAQAAVEEAVAGDLISSNDENANLVYLAADPNTNPLYSDLVSSGRHDFVIANTLVDTMNSLEDPRRSYYYTLADTSSETGVEKLAYVGGVYGASNDYFAYSHVADRIQVPTFEGTIFDYAETELLLAEAVERGFSVPGTAEEHYNAAVRASIEYWGGTQAEADTFLMNPNIAYATSPGDWKQKLGLQSWLTLYNRGFEAWTAWRKYDFPQLQAPPDALSDVPVRFTYPITEQTLNAESYNAGSDAIGGDDVSTKLFFDVN
ncbi:MAG TPA: SusD/RagB family nutrient-binding outer membrane lipoprotein [Bacteroidales bacterium]|nr:SusD/RagB family nutrient-binding outer membrane lipoprotein [Bacteroidales bacterium]